MKQFIISEEEKKHILNLYEQVSGTNKPIDLNYILDQSELNKTTNEFCKTKSGYDVCVSIQSSNPTVLKGKYGTRKNILTAAGYKMVEEDNSKPGILTSIWKKT
jgi:hypothetical protein